jgi:hypothetical protein
MDTREVALIARALGAFLLVASVVAIAYTVPVAPQGPCSFGCPAEPQTSTPYASAGSWLALVALATVWVGYSVTPPGDETEAAAAVPGGKAGRPTELA